MLWIRENGGAEALRRCVIAGEDGTRKTENNALDWPQTASAGQQKAILLLWIRAPADAKAKPLPDFTEAVVADPVGYPATPVDPVASWRGRGCWVRHVLQCQKPRPSSARYYLYDAALPHSAGGL